MTLLQIKKKGEKPKIANFLSKKPGEKDQQHRTVGKQKAAAARSPQLMGKNMGGKKGNWGN